MNVRSDGVRTAQERIEEAMREVAVLFLAFAPLDAALGAGPTRWWLVLLFLSLGAFLFMAALRLERKRRA